MGAYQAIKPFCRAIAQIIGRCTRINAHIFGCLIFLFSRILDLYEFYHIKSVSNLKICSDILQNRYNNQFWVLGVKKKQKVCVYEFFQQSKSYFYCIVTAEKNRLLHWKIPVCNSLLYN